MKSDFKRIIEKWIPQNTKVLDLGCGGGILSEAMAKLGANVTGIDPAERSIKVAKIHAEKSKSHPHTSRDLGLL